MFLDSGLQFVPTYFKNVFQWFQVSTPPTNFQFYTHNGAFYQEIIYETNRSAQFSFITCFI